jgi:nucleoside-diphosphate-sugar epimerase
VHVAVTGATGRVGSGVVDLFLARGHDVVAIDRQVPPGWSDSHAVDAVTVDVSDYDALLGALSGCDALVHLAAIPAPGRHPDAVVHNNNVVGSYNALRGAVETGISRICQASSINAIGVAFSRRPRFDYLPLDERHPTYAEDAYSLSKWICEQQADSIARRFDDVSIASLRLHLVVPDEAQARRRTADNPEVSAKHLWAWTSLASAAGACLLSLEAGFSGHRVFLVVAPRHVGPEPAEELLRLHYPEVPLRRQLAGDEGFFDCSEAERMLGWRHDGW